MTYISTKLKRDIEINEIITIHYFEYMKDFYFAGESHNFWEFLYVDKGCVTVRGGKREYLMDAGNIIFHKPDEFHTIRSEGNKAPSLVAVSFQCNSSAMNFFNNFCCILSERERQLISYILSEARKAFTSPLHLPSVEQVTVDPEAPFGAQQLILIYLECLLVEIQRRYTSGDTEYILTTPFKKLSTASKSDRIEQIIQYMEFHICEQLRVDVLCSTLSLSRSSLQNLFHQEKGCGAIDYFHQIKIERAKEIIREQKMSFTEIAHYLSYSSLQYFSRQFKKATGMSPLEYSNSVKTITNAVKSYSPRISNDTSRNSDAF